MQEDHTSFNNKKVKVVDTWESSGYLYRELLIIPFFGKPYRRIKKEKLIKLTHKGASA